MLGSAFAPRPVPLALPSFAEVKIDFVPRQGECQDLFLAPPSTHAPLQFQTEGRARNLEWGPQDPAPALPLTTMGQL